MSNLPIAVSRDPTAEYPLDSIPEIGKFTVPFSKQHTVGSQVNRTKLIDCQVPGAEAWSGAVQVADLQVRDWCE